MNTNLRKELQEHRKEQQEFIKSFYEMKSSLDTSLGILLDKVEQLTDSNRENKTELDQLKRLMFMVTGGFTTIAAIVIYRPNILQAIQVLLSGSK